MAISGGKATWKYKDCCFGGIVNLAMYLNYHVGVGLGNFEFFELNVPTIWEHLNCPDDWIDSWNALPEPNKEHWMLTAEEKLLLKV